MIALPLALFFLLPAAQEPASQQPTPAPQQLVEEERSRYEPIRQAAIHVNELAGSIHSEADAQAFVDAIAEHVTPNRQSSWAMRGIRHRVAHAEYEAVSDPSRLIPEQRVVDVWNEYVRELDAPEETLVTVGELHNLRDAMYTLNKAMWQKQRFPQSLWTMPDVYAVGGDGKVANGCRAVESLKILHDMSFSFQNVLGARDRVQKGVLISEVASQRRQDAGARPQLAGSSLQATRDTNPVRMAEYRYVQAHGHADYQRLLQRLFTELVPAE
jgi:hypothetical protein